jgi:hypothetical protein
VRYIKAVIAAVLIFMVGPIQTATAGTVLTLTGTGMANSLMKSELGGEITNGNNVIAVGTPWSVPFLDARRLQQALTALPSGTSITVFGYSKGAMAAEIWIKTYGPKSPLNPKFVLIGEPNRRYGGVATNDVIPTDTPFEVYTIARQYDRFADYPNVPSSPYYSSAVNTVNSLHTHNDYFHTSMYAPDNLVSRKGNITYILAPTKMADPVAQANVEQAYNRPEQQTTAAQGITLPVFDPPVKAVPQRREVREQRQEERAQRRYVARSDRRDAREQRRAARRAR